MSFKVVENGIEIECKIVLKFRDENNDKNYIVYKEDGNDELFASRYSVIDDRIVLDEIETEYEWNMIDNMLERSGDINEEDWNI